MATSIWKIDPAHSELGFKVKHMMISSVSGQFSQFEGQVTTNNEHFINAEFELTAKIDSISTRNADRDKHLVSDDFFSAAQHPELYFKSKAYDGQTMVGDLTIKGITQEIALEVEFNGIATDGYGQTKAGFEGSGSLNRSDFQLNWNGLTETGGVIVSNKVTLLINLQFVKQ